MTKKIAIVSSTFPPYRGGIGKVAEMDACQLAAAGFEVTVITPTAGEVRKDLPYAVRRIRPLFRYGNAGFCPQLAWIWREFDLVMLHYPFYGGAEPLAFGKPKSGGAKFALVYHMDTCGEGIVGAIFRFHRRFCAPWIIRKADVLIGTTSDYLNSSQVAPLIRRFGLKVRDLAPSVDVNRFVPGKPDIELMVKHGLDSSDRTVVFVGGLDRAHYFKGIPRLLKALSIKQLSEVRAIIVGDGEMRPEYEKQADALGLASRVFFVGRVSDEDLPRYYRLGDVFVFPSVDRSEAFGVAALEAMSCGLPVVASDLPGVRTIVRDGETGWRSRPASVSSFANRLADILDSDMDLERFGRNARQMAVEEYSDEMRAKKLNRIINETLS